MKYLNLIILFAVTLFVTACGTEVPQTTGYQVIDRNLADSQRVDKYRVAEEIQTDSYNYNKAVVNNTEHPGQFSTNKMYHDVQQKLNKSAQHGKAMRSLRMQNAADGKDAANDEVLISELQQDAGKLNKQAKRNRAGPTLADDITQEVKANLEAYVEKQGRLQRRWETAKNQIHISDRNSDGTQTHHMRDGSKIITNHEGKFLMMVPSKTMLTALEHNK